MEREHFCEDINGVRISQGNLYLPGPNRCQLCVCDRTGPKLCNNVTCKPSTASFTCKYYVMRNACCEFACLDKTPGADLKNEVDVRLLATNATAFVILIALLVLIYKQCRRTYQAKKRHNRLRAEGVLVEDIQGICSISFIAKQDQPPVHCPNNQPYANYLPRDDAPPPYDMENPNITLDMSAVVDDSMTRK